MQIETYEIEEIKGSEASTMAADSEAIELIQKLGLKGQQKLSNPDTATRFPYPQLSASQRVVFSTLFPEQSTVEDYSQGIIPLRVLQVIAFCKDLPQTQSLKIWHAHSVKEDPILIGAPGPYSSEQYLLARWGDSLLPFEALKLKALPLIASAFRLDISKSLTNLQGFLSSVDDLAAIYCESGQKPTWNIYE